MSEPITKPYTMFALISIFLIGAVLRITKLGFQCSWTEEDYTAIVASKSYAEIWHIVITADFTPPLFLWLQHTVGLVFGISDITMRYIPAISGILCIPAMYWLGKEYKDDLTGLYCAGITAVLFPFIYYSQFARAYTLCFLVYILALIMYVKIHKGDTSKYVFIGFGLLAGLTVWVHLYAIIPLTLMIIDVFLTTFAEKLTKITKLATEMLCSYALILLPLVQMPYTFLTLRTAAKHSDLPYGLRWFELIAATPTEFYNNIFPFIGLLAVFGLFLERESKIAVRIFVISIVTLVSGLILSEFTPIYPRYYMTVSIIFILMSAVSLSFITGFCKENWKKVFVLMVILLFFVVFQNESIINHFVSQRYVC